MTNELLFAGIDFSSGRQPVTFAALDDALNIVLLDKYEIAHVIAHLKQYGKLTLAVNVPSTKTQRGFYSDFKKKLPQTGLKPYVTKAAPKQFLETDAQACFRTLIEKPPLPRRTFEGRIQRGLILYDQGLHITDPMDFFEEITRHHMLDGVFPNELLHAASELNALAAAYVAWLAMNEPERVETTPDKLVLPTSPEHD
ncbi:MAG: hypothetical protein HXY35_14705 [Chloroflexi bacterium]|nr:hypothetical protein [Chloroflexota bacterium]